jgi:hypothetical protein
VRVLGDGCFSWARALRKVVFAGASLLERMGARCFYIYGIKEFDSPPGVAVIGKEAFSWCRDSERIGLANATKLTRVEDGCFRWCKGLKTVELPAAIGFVAASAVARWCALKIQAGPNKQKFDAWKEKRQKGDERLR